MKALSSTGSPSSRMTSDIWPSTPDLTASTAYARARVVGLRLWMRLAQSTETAPGPAGSPACAGERVPVRADAHICETSCSTRLFICWDASQVHNSSQNGAVDATPSTPIAPADSTNLQVEASLAGTSSGHILSQALPTARTSMNPIYGCSTKGTPSRWEFESELGGGEFAVGGMGSVGVVVGTQRGDEVSAPAPSRGTSTWRSDCS